MVKTDMVRARIATGLKDSVEKIFDSLGITQSQAIQMFYKQVELTGGLPFEVRVPNYRLDNAALMDDAAYDAVLEKGYHSAIEGNSRSSKAARAAFARRHRSVA